MSAGIVIGLLIVLAVIGLALRPLAVARRRLRPVAAQAESERLENLLFERETLLASLRDLQLDRQMNKLSDEDFAELDSRYRARAVLLLQELDGFGGAPELAPDEAGLERWIEQAVAELRQGRPRRGADELPRPTDA